MLCGNLLHSMSGATEFASFFSDKRRHDIVQGVLRSYYADTPGGSVVFDTNRTWTALLPLVSDLYPHAKVICCVRQVGWIIDSIERLTRRNAVQPSKLFNYRAGGSVYSRVETLMNPEKGLIGLAWSSMREAWFSELAGRLVVVDYERLATEPAGVMERLYAAIGEPSFQHDFENIVFDEAEYDADLGLPGLHRVRQRVSHETRTACIPPDLFAKYADVNFWLNGKLNPRQVLML